MTYKTSILSGEQVTGGLQTYLEEGANHIHLRVRSRSLDELLEQLERLDGEVIPQVSYK